jgi:GNAT superfamily N-acetyltransferase
VNCRTMHMRLTMGVQRAWMDYGPKIVLTRALKKIARPAFKTGSLVFFECDLRKPMPERRELPSIVIREATTQDAAMFSDQAVFFERLAEGHRCFMGIEKATGRLTNYRWVSTVSAYFPELQRHLILKPGEAYVYDLRTLPEFRRLGIDAYTRHRIYSYLRDTGYTKIYAYIHGDNRPSLNAGRTLLRSIGRVWYFELRGCIPIMISRRQPGFPELVRLPRMSKIQFKLKSE